MSEAAPAPRAGETRFAEGRSKARFAAVQALYQMDIGKTGAEAVIRQFQDLRFTEDGDLAGADAAHFEAVLRGVVADQNTVDAAARSVLAANWRLERLDATARAVLRAGAWEILNRPDVPGAVAVGEYVDVAAAFFEGPEPAFLNAALDALAKRERAGGDG